MGSESVNNCAYELVLWSFIEDGSRCWDPVNM